MDENDHLEKAFEHSLKESRKERRRMSIKDRSKYKKTDQIKWQKKAVQHRSTGEGLLRGRVLSVTPQGFSVQCEGELYSCHLRGVLKRDKSLMKNLLTVGD